MFYDGNISRAFLSIFPLQKSDLQNIFTTMLEGNVYCVPSSQYILVSGELIKGSADESHVREHAAAGPALVSGGVLTTGLIAFMFRLPLRYFAAALYIIYYFESSIKTTRKLIRVTSQL